MLLVVAGCQTDPNLVRVRNPFDTEAEAIGRFFSKKPQTQNDPEHASESLFGPEDSDSEDTRPERPEDLYFGQGTTGLRLPSKDKKEEDGKTRWFGKRKKTPKNDNSVAATPATSSSQQPRVEVATAVPDVPQSQQPTTDTNQGQPCYRCNGKGYRLSSLAAGAELVDCESCGGTGRK